MLTSFCAVHSFAMLVLHTKKVASNEVTMEITTTYALAIPFYMNKLTFYSDGN